MVTYGAVARALRSSPRAVGQALRHNPFAPVVPCHRVVAADRRLGGFNGHVGDCAELRRKRAMLEAEVCGLRSGGWAGGGRYLR